MTTTTKTTKTTQEAAVGEQRTLRKPPPAAPPHGARAPPPAAAAQPGNQALLRRAAKFPVATDWHAAEMRLPPGVSFGPRSESGALEFTLGYRFGFGGPPKRRTPPPCPSCHAPTSGHEDPGDPRVTGARLRRWAIDNGWAQLSEREQRSERIVLLTVAHDAVEHLLGGVRENLFERILGSSEFAGSDEQRWDASGSLGIDWPEVEAELRRRLENWYLDALAGAVGRTPPGASLETRPGAILKIVADPERGEAWMGRWDATATVGQGWGRWRIEQVKGSGYADVWLAHLDHPGWYYHLSNIAFRGLDPFVGMVFGQVAENTRFAALILPLLVQGAGLALGVSARLSIVVAGILLEELGEEGRRSAMGLEGRSPGEILKSAAGALLMDRIFGALGRLGEVPAPRKPAADVAPDPDALARAAAREESARAFAAAELRASGPRVREGAPVPGGGGHRVKVTPSGWLARCTDCALIRDRYRELLAHGSDDARALDAELRRLELTAARARQARDSGAMARVERQAADLAHRLDALALRLDPARVARPLDEFDFGPVDAIAALEIASGRRALPRPQRRFGPPSDETTGTFARTGTHFNELTAAEITHGVRLDYDAVAGRPNHVAYRVDAAAAEAEAVSARSFTQDVSVGNARSSDAAYRGSGLDRGHLVQREAVRGDADVERSVDSLSMVVPMHPDLNRGAGSPWRASESLTMLWAREHGSVRVDVWPVYGPNPARLADGTSVPRAVRRRVTAPDGTVLQDATHLNRGAPQ
jgi:hypothetical protein